MEAPVPVLCLFLATIHGFTDQDLHSKSTLSKPRFRRGPKLADIYENDRKEDEESNGDEDVGKGSFRATRAVPTPKLKRSVSRNSLQMPSSVIRESKLLHALDTEPIQTIQEIAGLKDEEQMSIGYYSGIKPGEAWPEELGDCMGPQHDPGPDFVPIPDKPGVYERDPKLPPLPSKKKGVSLGYLQDGKPRLLYHNGKPVYYGHYRAYTRPSRVPEIANKDTLRDEDGNPVSMHWDPTRLLPAHPDRDEEDLRKKNARNRRAAILLSAYDRLQKAGRLNFPIYTALIYSFSHIGAWRMSLKIYNSMSVASLRHDKYTVSGLLKGFAVRQHWQKALQTFELAHQSGIEVDNGMIELIPLPEEAPLRTYQRVLRHLRDPAVEYELRKKEERKQKRIKQKMKLEAGDMITDSSSNNRATSISDPESLERRTWRIEDAVFGKEFLRDYQETYYPKEDMDFSGQLESSFRMIDHAAESTRHSLSRFNPLFDDTNEDPKNQNDIFEISHESTGEYSDWKKAYQFDDYNTPRIKNSTKHEKWFYTEYNEMTWSTDATTDSVKQKVPLFD